MGSLRLLVQGYLHQDWPMDYASVWDAVDAFRASESPATVASLNADVRQLIDENYDEDALKRLLVDELGSGYFPPGDGSTFSDWLRRVADRTA
jgi:hypothetical protein